MRAIKRKVVSVTALIGIVGIGAAVLLARRASGAPEVTTDVVSRGSIVSRVAASGTVEAVTTVQVGTQVSGTVQALYADFNSIVKKGQILARLEPSLYQSEIQQNRANVARAEAEVERLRVSVNDAQRKLQRAKELAARELIPATELETAEMTQRTAEAQLRSAIAQVTQARATLSQAEVNLDKTIITSPIDGIVIARSVDVGQTVAASLQAPTLFQIAADLRELQVKASIDESDLGQVQAGQRVTFGVDAYPGQDFHGVVKQVRLNPVVEQNVVTYAAIITAENPDLKLRPGMTANVAVEVARRDDVLRVPSAALRFRPSDEVLAALRRGQQDGATAAAQGTQLPRAQGTAGGATAAASARGTATVWLFDGALHRATVQTGVSDGTFTEVIDGPIEEGARVATRATLGGDAAAGSGQSRPSSSPAGNPLLGNQPGPRRF